MPNSEEQWARDLITAINRADTLMGALPLSVPSPLRDHYFSLAVIRFMDKGHRARSCPHCIQLAFSMATTALESLVERMEMALTYLDKVEHL